MTVLTDHSQVSVQVHGGLVRLTILGNDTLLMPLSIVDRKAKAYCPTEESTARISTGRLISFHIPSGGQNDVPVTLGRFSR